MSYDPSTELIRYCKIGTAFIVSTGKLSAATSGNFNLTIENPSGSVKTTYLSSIIISSSNANILYGNVLETTPSSAFTNAPSSGLSSINLNRSCSGTSTFIVKSNMGVTASVSGISGGTPLFSFPVPGNQLVILDKVVLCIPSNKVIGINIPFLSSTDLEVQIVLWEE